MGSGFLVDASSGVLGQEDWVLADGSGTVRDMGSKSTVVARGGSGSRIRWKRAIRRERDGRDSLLGTTTDSSV